MAFDGLLITEIFYSLQGETSRSGLPFVFIRLTGCNLRCTYCDTSYAFHGGERLSLESVIERVKSLSADGNVLITGGEPLLQRTTVRLAKTLKNLGYAVSIETHGEVSIESVAPFARIIMDVKTPGSRMDRGGWQQNLRFLKPEDEVKFVITSADDYEWAKSIVQNQTFAAREILFSPVMSAENTPGEFKGVSPRWLGEQILKDRLPVRFQMQLHKILWNNQRGV